MLAVFSIGCFSSGFSLIICGTSGAGCVGAAAEPGEGAVAGAGVTLLDDGDGTGATPRKVCSMVPRDPFELSPSCCFRPLFILLLVAPAAGVEGACRRFSTYDAQPSRLRAVVVTTHTIGPADRSLGRIGSSKWLLSRLRRALQEPAPGRAGRKTLGSETSGE
jgi:hypothetical protein